MSGETGNSLCWYVVHTNPKQEGRVESNLRAWRVETFNPKLKVRRYSKSTYLQVSETKPLFPRYIFARFEAGKLVSKVRFTRGVHCVVSFGNGPTPVGDEIIDLIRSRIGKDGFVNTEEEFKPGDKIKVSVGPLGEMVGVFERHVNDSRRVTVLLTAIGYQAHIMTEISSVKKID